jgi:predicted nuclease of predicted toxin-antitoxin system
MKLLLDENLPVKLKYRLIERGVEAFTVTDKEMEFKTKWRIAFINA